MKPVILFVDDEPNILSGIRRFMRSHRNIWDTHFATSGAEAIRILEVQPVDVLVTDMRMPGIDGAELLEHVSAELPGIARIVLSGEAEPEQVYRVVGRSHRFMGKPCDPQALVTAIEVPLELLSAMGAERTSADVSFLDRLRSPASVLRILEARLQQDDVDKTELAGEIARDPNLSARLLQIVNSAYFGRPIVTSNIEAAVGHLGIDRLRELFARRRLGNNAQAYVPSVQHETALEASRDLSEAAAAIARDNGAGQSDIDVAYACGLFCDLGCTLGDQECHAIDSPTIAAYSAAYASALLGLPAELTQALRQLAALNAEPGNILERASIIARTVCETARLAA